MSSKTRLLYDAVFLKIRSLAPQFNPETSVSHFEIALYSFIKFVFSSTLQGCLFHYRQSLYRKWQQLGLSCVKGKEVGSSVKKLIALSSLPTNLIILFSMSSARPLLEVNVLDAMATFYSYVGKQWIQKCYLFMVNSAGIIPKSKVSIALGKTIGRKRPNFWFFLHKLKSVGNAYQLEANQLRKGILTRRYGRKMTKASDKFISESERKLATGRYTAQEFLQIVSHVTRKSFEKNGRCGKKIKKILEMTYPLWPLTIPSNALKSNATKMRHTVQNVAPMTWKKIIFVRNHMGICCAHSASKKRNVWNATQKLTQNLHYFLSPESL